MMNTLILAAAFLGQAPVWDRLPDREFGPNRGGTELGFTGYARAQGLRIDVPGTPEGAAFGMNLLLHRPSRFQRAETLKFRAQVYLGMPSCGVKRALPLVYEWESDPFATVPGDHIRETFPVQAPLGPGDYTCRVQVLEWVRDGRAGEPHSAGAWSWKVLAAESRHLRVE